jgi:hypothetical protein
VKHHARSSPPVLPEDHADRILSRPLRTVSPRVAQRFSGSASAVRPGHDQTPSPWSVGRRPAESAANPAGRPPGIPSARRVLTDNRARNPCHRPTTRLRRDADASMPVHVPGFHRAVERRRGRRVPAAIGSHADRRVGSLCGVCQIADARIEQVWVVQGRTSGTRRPEVLCRFTAFVTGLAQVRESVTYAGEHSARVRVTTRATAAHRPDRLLWLARRCGDRVETERIGWTASRPEHPDSRRDPVPAADGYLDNDR